MGIDGSSLVRLLDILESRGHIERHPSPDDRRVKLVMLTLTGREAAGAIRSHLNSIEQEMLLDLDDEQLAAMLEAFELIQARLTLMNGSARHG